LNRTRWIQYGAVLAIAFVLSIGAGAWIGRQRTGAPVANVPTPTPALTATATPSPAPPTATPAPTPTPSLLPATLPPPTSSPTSPATVPPSAPPPLDPATAEQFAMDLLAAFQAGDTQYLFDRLHPLVIERYGSDQCRNYTSGFDPNPETSWTVRNSSGPQSWVWGTDGLSTTVEGTWTVRVRIPDEGRRAVHFAPFEGTWRWFADCTPPDPTST
jgi:hypothetical protein